MEPFKPRFAVAQGQVSGTRLFLAIQARGYRGSRQVVRQHVAALRAGTAELVRADIPGTRACDLARAFADLVRHRRGKLLLEWIRQAEQDAPTPMK